MKKIGLHKPFDREQVCGVAIVEVLCRAFLEVEGQMVVLASGEIVNLVPDPPEKVPGPEKHGILPPGDDGLATRSPSDVTRKCTKAIQNAV